MQAMSCRRKTYRPDAITWADIEPEAVTGKQFRLSVRDKAGRAVLVRRPRSVPRAPAAICPHTCWALTLCSAGAGKTLQELLDRIYVA